MRPFRRFSAIPAPIPISDINTDDIIPARRMKTLGRAGLGRYLFEPMRYDADGKERPDFVLNQPQYRDAGLLITYPNFGSGSSREHAVWALLDYGIHCIVGPSFASIFATNCVRNGLLLVRLPIEQCDVLIEEARLHPGSKMTVDLERERIETPAGRVVPFEVDPVHRRLLLDGLDDIGRTLRHEDAISEFERSRS